MNSMLITVAALFGFGWGYIVGYGVAYNQEREDCEEWDRPVKIKINKKKK